MTFPHENEEPIGETEETAEEKGAYEAAQHGDEPNVIMRSVAAKAPRTASDQTFKSRTSQPK